MDVEGSGYTCLLATFFFWDGGNHSKCRTAITS